MLLPLKSPAVGAGNTMIRDAFHPSPSDLSALYSSPLPTLGARPHLMAGESESPPPPEASFTSLPKDLPSPLTRIPLDVAHHRQLIFSLDTPVQFDQQAWDKYWP